MIDGILETLLGETLRTAAATIFLHAFRRATIGKEEQRVIDGLRGFVKSWHRRYRASPDLEWGPAVLAGVRLEDWEEQKHALAAKIQRGLDGIDYNDKRQRAALEKVIESLAEATPSAAAALGGATSLLASALEAAATATGPLALKFYKEFLVGGPAGDALRDMDRRLAARCEMAAALQRTGAVRELIAVYDERCEKQLRRRGLLGPRRRRESPDGRVGHRRGPRGCGGRRWISGSTRVTSTGCWTNSSDTSRADWLGLLPLIDEAAGDGEGSMFIVGDRKQAIYAWRGGEVGLFDEEMNQHWRRIGSRADGGSRGARARRSSRW